LVLSVENRLAAYGLAQSDKGAVRRAIIEVRTTQPETWSKYELEDMRQGFYTAQKLPPPPVEPREVLIGELCGWGVSAGTATALVDRLVASCTVTFPHLGLDYIKQMFEHVTRMRKLRTVQMRIDWLKREADELESPRLYRPIRPQDTRPNAKIELISAALHDGLSAVSEIAERAGFRPETVQELLGFMISPGVGMAVHLEFDRYGPPQEGATGYMAPGKKVLKALESGRARKAELRNRTDLTDPQLTGALNWHVHKSRKVNRVARGLYELSGATPSPRVDVRISEDMARRRHAVVAALRCGEKSVPELEEIVGCSNAAMWSTLRSLEGDGLVEHIEYRSTPGFRGRVAVFGLTAKGRRLERRRQSDTHANAHTSL
jgi:DNA-binding HxlR family transcriptional regulator